MVESGMTLQEAGCARGCVPCRGSQCARYGNGTRRNGVSACADHPRDIIQETVDAVSGATWGTRNMIMEDLFLQDMEEHGDTMPSYRPPGA